MVTLSKEGKLQAMLEDEVAKLQSEGKAGSYQKNILKAIISWLDYNGLKLQRRIKISGADLTPTLDDERVPTKEELVTILRHLDKRGRAIAAYIAFAGLRLEAIGNYDGTDGLTIKDLPEMKVTESGVVFEKIPTMIKIRSSLSKTRRPYFTFLTSEGCTYLKEYLEWRMARGEKLESDTPLFGHSAMSRRTKRKFLWGRRLEP